MSEKIGWGVSVSGTVGESEKDKLLLVRQDPPPRILLEIDVPGLRSLRGEGRRHQGRQAIQQAIDALQEALNSPKALAGFRAD